jgi:CheY-like chemotaxis protein
MARILVVEDNVLIASLLADWLKGAGHQVVGPVGMLEPSLEKLADIGADAALVDIFLGSRPNGLALAEILSAQRIPFGFLSGYSVNLLPIGLRYRPRVEKPFERETVLAFVDRLLEPGQQMIG